MRDVACLLMPVSGGGKFAYRPTLINQRKSSFVIVRLKITEIIFRAGASEEDCVPRGAYLPLD